MTGPELFYVQEDVNVSVHYLHNLAVVLDLHFARLIS